MQLIMPAMFEVSTEDISYAEKILLGHDQHFDDERIAFIKDFSTLDLQAVPGSGKTTALLAKLLILELKLPLAHNRGVLIVSHTNIAVDEIKDRIGIHCPKLFSHPNFIGTIQSFVDIFLAVPCYTNKYGEKPYRIDNEIYDEQVEKFYNTTRNQRLKNYLDRQRDGLTFLKSVRLNSNLNLISYLKGTEESFKIQNKQSPTYISLKGFKTKLLKWGYLHFDDAYFLAEYITDRKPRCIDVIRQRFQYIFIDEIQDMDFHQHNLIEKIFVTPDTHTCYIQRIGDKNQAIFNGFSDSENVWEYRDTLKFLSGSHRLSRPTASVVEKLALVDNPIEGRRTNPDGSAINIKPTIIIYTDQNIKRVIETFADCIKQKLIDGEIPQNIHNVYQAVAWRREHQDEDKYGLKDYCPKFNEINVKSKIDFNCLNDYLSFFDIEKRTLESIRKNILNALLRILRLENIKTETGIHYSKRKLINFIKSLGEDKYEEFKLNIYTWSIGVIRGDQGIREGIKLYIPTLLENFEKTIDQSERFINSDSEIQQNEQEISENNNLCFGDIKIEVGTVHSVKGQTNTATLYLESFFDRGYGNYESERLRNQILGVKVSETLDTNVSSKQKIIKSTKMAYVGFSRPTHLLCFAVHKDRFDSCLTEIDRDIWNIIEIEKSQ